MILRILSFTILLVLPTISVFGQDITIGDDGIVRCKDVEIGTKKTIFGDEYEVVDRNLLEQRRDEGSDLSKVCVSNVTNMSELFFDLNNSYPYQNKFSDFNQDIGNWDVSSVTDMNQMFRRSGFNQDIGNWDVSSVTDMSVMFRDSPFNQNISDWDVSSVTDMRDMFRDSPFNQDISNWEVSSVTDMGEMFRESDFNQDIGNWDVSSVTDMSGMFVQTPFNQDIGNWDVSSVTDMGGMFNNSPLTKDISNWDVSSVSDMSGMFFNSNFNQDIGNWDVSSVTNMSYMFSGSSFNQDIGNWDVSSVTDIRYMFRESDFNQDIGNWDVSSVTDMSYMFYESLQFNQDIGNWDVSSVTNMKWMFRGSDFNQDLSGWCVPLITSEPEEFSSNSPLQSNYKPIWGTCPGIPSTPTITSPPDNSTDVSLNVEFEWTTDDLTTHTQLQIFEGIDPIVVDTTISNTTFTNTKSFKSNTTYNWRIRGINQSDSLGGEPKMSDWSSVTSFTTLLLPPESITLSSPSDESTGVTLTPTLSWSEDTNSESYTLQVSTDGFESFVVNESLTETSFTTPELEYNTEYSWRVRGTNSSGDGDYSEVWTFTTQYRQLSPSTPLNPQDGQVNVGTLTDFRWSEVDSVESYQIQVTTDSTFTTQMFQSEEIDSTTFTLTDPIRENTQYFWRVRSLGEVEQQHSEWSEVMSFTTGVRTSVEGGNTIPTDYSLNQNYPNPFNPTTTITYSLPQSGMVILNVYDITGRFITTLVDGIKGVGTHSVQFEGSSLSSGMYVYTLQTDGYRQTRQMMLVK